MKVNYKPGGNTKNVPKQWEVWLADTPFGETGKKRCSVLVAKRATGGFTVHEIIPTSLMGGKDVIISDPMRAGQDRPAAIRTGVSATLPNTAFVQKLGSILESDVTKVISAKK